MTKHKMFNYFATLCLLSGWFALAQSGVGVSPPRAELQVVPGSQVTQEVLIDNPSLDTPLDISVAVSDALFQPDGEVVYLAPGSHPNSLADWLSINPLQFVLEPSSSESVAYTLQVPDTVPDGTYWTVIFFESEPSGAAEETGFSISSRVRVGHIVYADVGEITLEGEIVGMRYDTTQTPEVRVAFRNTGNGLARVEGTVEMRDESGALLSTLNVPSTATFPGYTRDIVIPLEAPLEPGNYVLLAVLDYGTATVTAGEGRIEVP